MPHESIILQHDDCVAFPVDKQGGTGFGSFVVNGAELMLPTNPFVPQITNDDRFGLLPARKCP